MIIFQVARELVEALEGNNAFSKAVFLQKLSEILEHSSIEKDGYKWVNYTLDEWQQEIFTWVHPKTIGRMWSDLAEEGAIIKKTFDSSEARNWIRINEEWLDKMFLKIGKSVPLLKGTIIKENKRGAKRDPLLNHPAILTYKSVAHYQVLAVWRSRVVEVVGDKPNDVERWRQTIFSWLGKGWNPKNIEGMLEAYQSGSLLQQKSKTREQELIDAGYKPA